MQKQAKKHPKKPKKDQKTPKNTPKKPILFQKGGVANPIGSHPLPCLFFTVHFMA